MRVCRLSALFAALTPFGQAPNPPIALTPEQVAQGKAILAQYKAISLQCVDLHNASHRANQALATDPSKLPAAQDAAAAEAAAQQQLVEKAGEYKKLTAGCVRVRHCYRLRLKAVSTQSRVVYRLQQSTQRTDQR